MLNSYVRGEVLRKCMQGEEYEKRFKKNSRLLKCNIERRLLPKENLFYSDLFFCDDPLNLVRNVYIFKHILKCDIEQKSVHSLHALEVLIDLNVMNTLLNEDNEPTCEELRNIFLKKSVFKDSKPVAYYIKILSAIGFPCKTIREIIFYDSADAPNLLKKLKQQIENDFNDDAVIAIEEYKCRIENLKRNQVHFLDGLTTKDLFILMLYWEEVDTALQDLQHRFLKFQFRQKGFSLTKRTWRASNFPKPKLLEKIEFEGGEQVLQRLEKAKDYYVSNKLGLYQIFGLLDITIFLSKKIHKIERKKMKIGKKEKDKIKKKNP